MVTVCCISGNSKNTLQSHEVSLADSADCKSFMKSGRLCGFSRISCDNGDNDCKRNEFLLLKCLFQGLSGAVVLNTNELVGFWSFGFLHSGKANLFTRVSAFVTWIKENGEH